MSSSSSLAQLSKTESEASSLSLTKPAAYYVQSPSRDSHDGEKTTNSFHSTPLHTPTASPSRSHFNSNSSSDHHSRESSSTRFSVSLKPKTQNRKFDSIEEEQGLLDGENSSKLTRRFYLLCFFVGFFVLFTLFSLILYGASRPQTPKIIMKNIVFDRFAIQAGEDSSGVATDMVSMNSTVKLTFHNTATFFGVHVTSTPLSLSFSQLTLATGTFEKFYQRRKSHKSITVTTMGVRVPLYGGGASLSNLNGVPIDPVPLTLNLVVRSRAYVLGKLVKPKFYNKVQCSLVMDPKKMNVPVQLKNKCTYR